MTNDSGIIEIDGLTKIFRSGLRRREVCAVRDVTLKVSQGSVVAFIGPNGAGKTTTIYMLLGLLRPTHGAVRLFGLPAGSMEARRRTGFQSEIFYTYGFKTAKGALRFYGELSEMPDDQIEAAAPQQLQRLGLGHAQQRKIRGFSKGMIQRLGIAQALLHRPELLILDEPTTGLDPEGRKLVADIILEEKTRGTTVFLSSHILSDVERTCDHVVILREGRVVFSESMDTLRGASAEWEIEVLNWSPAALEAIGRLEIRDQKDGVVIVRCPAADKNAILRTLLEVDADVGAVRRAASLEDLYMRYAGGSSSG
jgi:ABC-2 type transport system ATP-binding protein